MWELDHKEGWAPKNWCLWAVVLEKTLESPWYCKEIKPVNPKGNQSWVFPGRTDAEAEVPIRWPPAAKSWLTSSLEKTLMLGKIEGKRRKGWQRMKWLDSITDSMYMNLNKLPEMVKDRRASRVAVHGVTKIRTQPSNWKTKWLRDLSTMTKTWLQFNQKVKVKVASNSPTPWAVHGLYSRPEYWSG